jgi:CubicO group peptidase (beta-lactamase class C family)
LALALALAPPASDGAATRRADEDRLVERAEELARAFVARENVAGISVALARGDELLLEAGYGYADLEHLAHADGETVYRIGSLTQQLTAAAILKLAEAERLSLEDPLSVFFPEWPEPAAKVTLRQLLTHTSGIPSYTGLGLRFGDDFCRDMTREDIVALFRDRPLEFEPGTQFSFSSSGYFLLGLILEQASGQEYTSYLASQIFRPLGMDATVYCYEDRLLVHRASGYQDIAGELHPDLPFSIEHPFSAGALCSTVGDLVRWQRGLIGGLVLRESTWREMCSPAELADGTEIPFGLGLGLDDTEGHPAISYGGGINGFRSHLAYYPELDLTIVVLANSERAPVHELEHAIARVALGLEPEELRDLPLLPDQMQPYLGSYNIGSSRYLVRARGPRLVLVPPLAPEYELLYQGEHRFVSSVEPDTRVVFGLDEDGRAVWFRLIEGGCEQLARRLE